MLPFPPAPAQGDDRGNTRRLAEALRRFAELHPPGQPGGSPGSDQSPITNHQSPFTHPSGQPGGPPDPEPIPAQLGPCFHLLLEAGLVRVPGNGALLRLTELGLGLMQLLQGCHTHPDPDHLPRYDARRRILHWRGAVAKRLARQAPCQETVLQAFHEAGWPERISDPLGEEYDLDPKERLRETVKSLNEGLAEGTIRFHADGTGGGIRWEVVWVEKVLSPPDHP